MAVSVYALIWFRLRVKGYGLMLKLYCNAQFSSNEDSLIYIWKPVPTANVPVTKEGVCRAGAAGEKADLNYSARTLVLYEHVNYYHWNRDFIKEMNKILNHNIILFFWLIIIENSKLKSIALAGTWDGAASKGDSNSHLVIICIKERILTNVTNK